MQFLAIHSTCLSVFEAKTLECLKQWVPELAPISQATFSCDGLMVYACFVDGTISIFDASHLGLHCWIISTAYLPPRSSFDVYPLVIAAHPQKPNQFVVGLKNGGVVVFEPINTTGKWSTSPTDEDGSASTTPIQSVV